MIISYAQNYEDVILWRALGHIRNGFYVDVGAWSPTIDSVTKTFYDNGWHGINIEPEKQMYQMLESERRRDTNLRLAISDSDGMSKMFFNVNDSALSTLDQSVSLNNKNKFNLYSYEEYVKTITLKQLWDNHIPENRDVNFLKVDVEGFEYNVLSGNDWSVNRPWVVVVESNIPMTRRPSQDKWEHILLDSDYLFVYADGMNRFYLAKEHEDLLHHFEFPINVFDHFIPIEVETMIQRINELENKMCDDCKKSLDYNWGMEYPERNYEIK